MKCKKEKKKQWGKLLKMNQVDQSSSVDLLETFGTLSARVTKKQFVAVYSLGTSFSLMQISKIVSMHLSLLISEY